MAESDETKYEREREQEEDKYGHKKFRRSVPSKEEDDTDEKQTDSMPMNYCMQSKEAEENGPFGGQTTFRRQPRKRSLSVSSNEEEEISAHQSKKEKKDSSPEESAPEQTLLSGKGLALLQKAGGSKGFTLGSGLGSKNQGIVEPIKASAQHGRRGLGTKKTGLETDLDAKWDHTQETGIVKVEEQPEWIPKPDVPLELDHDWIKIGLKKEIIDDETNFCNEDELRNMLSAKNVFDELPDRQLQSARSRANPYETIKGAFFQNRAAMKMANMDKVFDWILTSPKDTKAPEKPLIREGELFYFVDICAGPGGFTEYVLWKKKWDAHGFGMTLIGNNDFRLDKFTAADPELFEPFYGRSGKPGDGGDGDITNPKNLLNFEAFVKKSSRNEHGEGAHLVMADGGFSVAGKENLQEILSKRIYLGQFLCALSVLRPGGNFVCKLFDVFTPFSAGLVYLMYHAFEQISIHKPNTSRPANSERYIICEGMKPREISRPITEFMRAANDKLEELSSHEDVTELVPLEIMQGDEAFFNYLSTSNNELARRQAVFLNKYKQFAMNPNLLEQRQGTLREECLAYYEIPDLKREDPPRANPGQMYQKLCNEQSPLWGSRKPQLFKNFDAITIPNNYPGLDFRCSVSCEASSYESSGAFLLISMGKRFQYYWNAIGNRWDRLDMVMKGEVLIPKNTLLYAESTWKYTGKGKGQKKVSVLRVFDAYVLGSKNVSQLPYDQRMEQIRKFCKAISHQYSLPACSLVEPAEVWLLKDFHKHSNRFTVAGIKGAKRLILYDSVPSSEEHERTTLPYFVCRGLYLHRTVNEPWCVCWSKSRHSIYYWKPKLQEGIVSEDWEKHDGLISTFKETCQMRMLWNWDLCKDVETLLKDEPTEEDPMTLKTLAAVVT